MTQNKLNHLNLDALIGAQCTIVIHQKVNGVANIEFLEITPVPGTKDNERARETPLNHEPEIHPNKAYNKAKLTPLYDCTNINQLEDEFQALATRIADMHHRNLLRERSMGIEAVRNGIRLLSQVSDTTVVTAEPINETTEGFAFKYVNPLNPTLKVDLASTTQLAASCVDVIHRVKALESYNMLGAHSNGLQIIKNLLRDLSLVLSKGIK